MRIKTVLTSITLLTLFATLAFSQINSLNIAGPEQVQPGQLVRLTAELNEKESPFWIVLHPADLDYEQVEEGHRLIFSVGCRPEKTIVVMLLAQQVIDGRIETRQLLRRIKVQTDLGDPTIPDDQPQPEPKPPVDNEFLKAASAAFATVTLPSARQKSQRIADNFEAIANRCQQKEFKDRSAVWLTLSSMNYETLDGDTEPWESFAIAIQIAFKKLQLKDTFSHSLPLRTVAAAIRKGTKQ
jgi:hypothetical protein